MIRKALLAILAATALAIPTLGLSGQATTFTVSPWAYACSATTSANPATAVDPGAACDHNGSDTGLGTGYCSGDDTPGSAHAAYVGGTLTLDKNGPACDDMSSGATIGGLTSLSAASYDVSGPNACSGGSPRLNVVTGDGKTHFFGCGPDNTSHHVTVDFSAAADGSGNGGVAATDKVTEIDFVLDQPTCNAQATAAASCINQPVSISNISFTGTAVTPSPSPSASATPSPSATPTPTPVASALPNASTEAPAVIPGSVLLALLGLLLLAVIGGIRFRRRN